MIKAAVYNLPDIALLGENCRPFIVWVPDQTYIVLGSSNKPEESLITENICKDGIPVLKRPSGGQAVLLTPNNLVVSVVFTHKESIQPKDVFKNINTRILSAIEETGIKGLELTGISDIAIDGKKILGSAIYRSKDKLLYQAVLNVGEPASSFEKYLKHPVKEPAYRGGRKHLDFVTSLKDHGYNRSYEELAGLIEKKFHDSIFTLFSFRP